MKNLYKTFAIAAVAAVSMFSAQSAKAQTVGTSNAIEVAVEDSEWDNFTSEQEISATSSKAAFMQHLKNIKDHNIQVTTTEAMALMKKGMELGLTLYDVLSYLPNIVVD